ncbi:MAG: PH domain-containing protein [Gemmataceae bacterium]
MSQSSTVEKLPERRIREVYRATDGVCPPLARLGAALVQSGVLAPLGLLILAPLWLLKFAPFWGCQRYTITNRRLLIRRGWRPYTLCEMPLSELAEVRLDENRIDRFFLSATLQLVDRQGQVRLTLSAVPEPAGFRQSLLAAQRAWGVPATEVTGPFLPASGT